jgi:hypothetical protein
MNQGFHLDLNLGETAYSAQKFFSGRDGFEYDTEPNLIDFEITEQDDDVAEIKEWRLAVEYSF